MSLWLWHLFGNFIRSPHRLFVSSTRRLKNSRVYSTMCSVVDMLSVPGTTFQMKGSMLELCFLDYNGLLIPVEAEVWCDGRDPTDRREKRKFSSPVYQLLELDLCWAMTLLCTPISNFIVCTNSRFHYSWCEMIKDKLLIGWSCVRSSLIHFACIGVAPPQARTDWGGATPMQAK